MAPTDPLQEARDELREAPPKRFTPTRTALVKRLREQGHDAAAKELGRERKPSASVWAVAALARAGKAELDRLLEEGAALQTAQRQAVAGQGGALREANTAHHEALEAAVDRAGDLLWKAGEQATEAVLERVRQTLKAASTGDRELRETLKKGELSEDLSAAGFGPAFAYTPAPGKPHQRAVKRKAAPREPPREPASEKRARAARLKAEREAWLRAEKAVREAEKAYRRAEEAAEAADARAIAARHGADRAQRALRDARDTLQHTPEPST